MEKTEYYFVINEVGNSDGGHMGIIKTDNNEEFNEKLGMVIQNHFALDSIKSIDIQLTSILGYDENEFTIVLEDETDSEGNEAIISIQRSWIY